MVLHTIGDSHSGKGWERIPNVKVHHLGPILCHSFGDKGLNRVNIKKLSVTEGDSVCFCFGEIDCRCHVHNHSLNGKNYKEIINNLTNNYFNAIHQNENLYKNIKIFVYNVVPPLKDNHRVVIKHKTINDYGFPFVGSQDDRLKYVTYFNECLDKKCKEYGYNFIDVYDEYSNEDKFMKIEYSDNHVHIKNPQPIINFLKENKGGH